MPKTLTQEDFLYETKWTQAERDAHQKAGGYFAGPNQTFPLKTADDVPDAWGLAGHADNPDQVRANIKRWAKDNGHYDALPDTAKDDGEKQESGDLTASLRAMSDFQSSMAKIQTEAGTAKRQMQEVGQAILQMASQESAAPLERPKKKIGTLPICWLEYNARSLNGRIYPKSTCDAIFRAAQQVLSDPNALPPTTFVSHEDANGNRNTALIGAPVKVWQEGSKFWAHLDIADTSVARDILGLVEGKYLRSGSMRVAGVELMHDRNYDLPLVIVQEGVTPQFLGIDLTTRPGLVDIARIPQVLYESDGQVPYIECFNFEVLPLEEEAPMSIPLYLQVIAGTMTEAMTADRAAHQRIHDHLAGVMDSAVKECHGNESAHFKALVEGQLDEAGRAIAQKHAVAIAAAHDEAAKQCGMSCEGCYKEALGVPLDPDQDGDSIGHDTDNDNESAQKGNKVMTEEEMLAALKAKGYTVATPKTVQEELEELRTKVKALEESRATTTEAPQRLTQAPSAMSEQASDYQPEQLYMEGDYLKNQLHPRNWRALADPRVPWPKDVDPLQAVKELSPFLAYRLNMEEAAARGRDISMIIGEYEQV